jgi:hypothetical protein
MLFILLAAALFYAVLPLWGAWRVRRSWTEFRESAIRALDVPELDFSLVQVPSPLPGAFRLTGTLEAFEGNDRLWIGNRRVSVAVSLRGAPVYFLDEQSEPFGAGVEPPRKAEAALLGALPEGTQFLVAGGLARDERGQVHFSSANDQRLLVLAFEGDPQTVLIRAVFSGRSVVDHWNAWTPVSLGIGFVSLLILAYLNLRSPGNLTAGLLGLALALLPSTFFLPPGIVFFYSFARLWALARQHRARMDLARLGGGEACPPRTFHLRKALFWEVMAQLCLLAGILANGLLLVMAVHWWRS